MLKIITPLSMVLAAHLAQAQTQVEAFTKIEAKGDVRIVVKQAQAHSVEFLEGSGQASADVEKGLLKISADPGRQAVIEVSAPNVASLRADGSEVTISGGLSHQKVSMRLSTGASVKGNVAASKISIAARSGSSVAVRLQAESFAGSFSGKSRASLSGKTSFAKLDADGSSLCLARNLISSRAAVRAAGNSDMTVNTLGRISISVDETAKITCIGERTPAATDTRVVLAH